MALKTTYKNRLPHIAPIGAAFFVTFRLGDSLPRAIIKELRRDMERSIQKLENEKPHQYKKQISQQRKKYFKRFEHQLDDKPYGHCYLSEPVIAELIQDKLHEFDNSYYELISYCIMPNHVHVVLDTAIQLVDDQNQFIEEVPEDYMQLHDIMQRIKGSTSYKANQLLEREGPFWAKDSFDHYVRDEEELINIIQYIVLNPVKAGLVQDWHEYTYTYVKEGYELG